MYKCDYCKQIFDGEPNELFLDGTNDVVHVTLCDKCYSLLATDYYSPEDVDKIF